MTPEPLETDGLYKIKAHNVVAQVIDGEALLIAFETGTYYSSVGSGASILAALRVGATIGHLSSQFAAGSNEVAVRQEVRTFIEELVAEGLVEAVEATEASDSAFAIAELAPTPPFEKPVLQKYSDLEDLLLLDPIHDVDSAGWPRVKASP